MATKKITRKQLLKEPDEFITFTGRLIRFATQHKIHFVCAAAALFFLLITVSALRIFINKSEDNAFVLLGNAMRKYETILKESGAKTAFSEMEADFQEILKKYPRRNAGKFARVILANICYNADELDRAITLYARALEDFSDQPYIKNFILNGLGHSYESKKDYEMAATYFDRLAFRTDSILKEEALFHLGWLYDKLGNKSESQEAFLKLLSDYPESIYIEMIQERMSG